MGSLTTCRQCGMSFNPNHHLTRYCGHRCRSEAQQDRQLAPAAGLDVRAFNGVPIQRRQVDGYVNATAMCKANGKKWNDYARLDRTQAYIAALAAVAGNPATENHGLIHVIQGGLPHLQGTWVHPRLAVDLARWISPQFAVWMDGWLLEQLQHPAAAAAAPQPAPRTRAKGRRTRYAPGGMEDDGSLPSHYWEGWDQITEEERQARMLLQLLRAGEESGGLQAGGISRAIGCSGVLLQRFAIQAAEAGLQLREQDPSREWTALHQLAGALHFAQVSVAMAQQRLLGG